MWWRLATSRFAFARRIHDIARTASLSKSDAFANRRPAGEAAGLANPHLFVGNRCGRIIVACLNRACLVRPPSHRPYGACKSAKGFAEASGSDLDEPRTASVAMAIRPGRDFHFWFSRLLGPLRLGPQSQVPGT